MLTSVLLKFHKFTNSKVFTQAHLHVVICNNFEQYIRDLNASFYHTTSSVRGKIVLPPIQGTKRIVEINV